jgi:predicted HicB family RNase H-like nuclease
MAYFTRIKEFSSTLPPPTNKKYSGKFVLRVGSELHQALAVKAMNDGDSLNSYVVKALRKEFTD